MPNVVKKKTQRRAIASYEVLSTDPFHVHDIFLRLFASAQTSAGDYSMMSEKTFAFIDGHLSGCRKCNHRYETKFRMLGFLHSLEDLLSGYLGKRGSM